MEHLATWNQVYFARCVNPEYIMTRAVINNFGNARFWTDKEPNRCPHCGYWPAVFDET